MPYLNCGVDDCIHNYNFFCGLPDIKVDGQKAKAAHENALLQLEKATALRQHLAVRTARSANRRRLLREKLHCSTPTVCAEPHISTRKLRHDLRGRPTTPSAQAFTHRRKKDRGAL